MVKHFLYSAKPEIDRKREGLESVPTVRQILGHRQGPADPFTPIAPLRHQSSLSIRSVGQVQEILPQHIAENPRQDSYPSFVPYFIGMVQEVVENLHMDLVAVFVLPFDDIVIHGLSGPAKQVVINGYADIANRPGLN